MNRTLKLTPEQARKCLQRSTPVNQKFPAGCRVRIADDLGAGMRHFRSGQNATVLYTYLQAYGQGSAKMYSLDIDGYGSVSWYYEHQLTLIKE